MLTCGGSLEAIRGLLVLRHVRARSPALSAPPPAGVEAAPIVDSHETAAPNRDSAIVIFVSMSAYSRANFYQVCLRARVLFISVVIGTLLFIIFMFSILSFIHIRYSGHLHRFLRKQFDTFFNV